MDGNPNPIVTYHSSAHTLFIDDALALEALIHRAAAVGADVRLRHHNGGSPLLEVRGPVSAIVAFESVRDLVVNTWLRAAEALAAIEGTVQAVDLLDVDVSAFDEKTSEFSFDGDDDKTSVDKRSLAEQLRVALTGQERQAAHEGVDNRERTPRSIAEAWNLLERMNTP